MLSERAQSSLKRPAWCIAHIMKILEREFDAKKLKGAREKAQKYMAKSALTFKRLRNISVDAWEAMGEAERLKKSDLVKEFELSAEQWRIGPYGSIWEGGKIKRMPTATELTDFKERRVLGGTIPSQPTK